MATSHSFSHQLPNNTKKLKRAFAGISVMIILCVGGMVLGEMFWDEYTYPVRSLRTGATYTGGWPATLFNWSLWLGVAGVICLPMMYFMQDFKNPSLALTNDALFINQQMMRNTLVPYSNIETIAIESVPGGFAKGMGYKIIFKDPSQIVKQQIFLFKPFVRTNLKMGNFFISDIHSSGNVEEFMQELRKRIG